jgi:hypothetical protein
MKPTLVFLLIASATVGLVWGAYQAASPSQPPLSSFTPAGAVLYLEARDFSSLLADWNSSPQKAQWITSANYEVFSRSRLFLRLKGAGDQFATAAGLPPDMNFLAQVAGTHSALALYDIGNLQFLYIARLPSAKSMETTLWQTRAKFEPRSAGGVDFYVRRDPESQKEVAFAVSGDYLLLATRSDLMAGALELMSGSKARTIESEPWWSQPVAAAGKPGDLRMVLNLEKLVPTPYFRTYWVQQNITDLKQYSAALSDLFRSSNEYREERVLLRKSAPPEAGPPPTGHSLPEAAGVPGGGSEAVADLVRLVPDHAGIYEARAYPSADSALSLLETKLLAPHLGPAPPSQLAPTVQLTSGDTGGGSDLETRIDQSPLQHAATQATPTALKDLLDRSPLVASLEVQSTAKDKPGVFVRTHSAVVLLAASDWNQPNVQEALSDFIRPGLTASQLGASWSAKSGYQQLDGLWPLTLAVHGKELLVSDDPALMEALLANLGRKSDQAPAVLIAGFSHARERENFAHFTGSIDNPNRMDSAAQAGMRQPQFFSDNLASLSATLSAVAAEHIQIREDGNRVQQTVTYEWSQ